MRFKRGVICYGFLYYFTLKYAKFSGGLRPSTPLLKPLNWILLARGDRKWTLIDSKVQSVNSNPVYSYS